MFDKRGISHVEAVISFVIFIGFLIFTFFFFSPFRGTRTLDSTLEYAYREIKGFSEMDVQSYSVVITDSHVPGTAGILIANGISFPNVSVERSDGAIISSYVLSGSNTIYFDIPADKFAKIRYGNDYAPPAPPGGPPFPPTLVLRQYNISSSEEKRVYSMKRVANLSIEYDLYYSDLKKRFNLPNRVDFGFSFTLKNGSIIKAEKEIPQNAEVKARNERVELTRTDGAFSGEEQFADLIVKVW